MTKKVLSNTDTAKQALLGEFKMLGGNYLKGTTAIADMLKLVAVNAADKLVSEGDAPAILQSWLDGAGWMQENTQKKLQSNILVMIRAGSLPKG